jgi:hypothetical protein
MTSGTAASISRRGPRRAAGTARRRFASGPDPAAQRRVAPAPGRARLPARRPSTGASARGLANGRRPGGNHPLGPGGSPPAGPGGNPPAGKACTAGSGATRSAPESHRGRAPATLGCSVRSTDAERANDGERRSRLHKVRRQGGVRSRERRRGSSAGRCEPRRRIGEAGVIGSGSGGRGRGPGRRGRPVRRRGGRRDRGGRPSGGRGRWR